VGATTPAWLAWLGHIRKGVMCTIGWISVSDDKSS
jgi:hypothetical protein